MLCIEEGSAGDAHCMADLGTLPKDHQDVDMPNATLPNLPLSLAEMDVAWYKNRLSSGYHDPVIPPFLRQDSHIRPIVPTIGEVDIVRETVRANSARILANRIPSIYGQTVCSATVLVPDGLWTHFNTPQPIGLNTHQQVLSFICAQVCMGSSDDDGHLIMLVTAALIMAEGSSHSEESVLDIAGGGYSSLNGL
ncbi:hypothetical protein OF83DRAFT_1180765 [Amylostereum chailletii]|nr:hypothetical protein OF83DRAFT_1180765 [Amylostereum chailletii]